MISCEELISLVKRSSQCTHTKYVFELDCLHEDKNYTLFDFLLDQLNGYVTSIWPSATLWMFLQQVSSERGVICLDTQRK